MFHFTLPSVDNHKLAFVQTYKYISPGASLVINYFREVRFLNKIYYRYKNNIDLLFDKEFIQL